MDPRHLFPALIMVITTAASVPAQSLWSFEGRAGMAQPSSSFAGVDLSEGLGLDATVRLRIQPHLHLYGGWDWVHFTSGDAALGGDADVEETGYVYGIRFQHPVSSRLDYWLRAGGTFDHIEIEDADGDLIEDSGHGAGWEVGAGIAVRVRGAWALTPGLRYRALTRRMSPTGPEESVSLRYVMIELGFARALR